ncbi:phage baseplate upper protein [Staphylococcus pasteuri]|uniref:phage baseplate upper protein n=1 Tax=Staphylococcus pasteuri TaxID=45972 RepID=UPI00249B3343|nr:phage baseplate upper protein [Staphylococcus pasteuri]MDI3231009.1 phage baseplate upper protein [Staphylococcus pasteuri]
MINKHKDIETNISSSNIDIGDIGCRFYTEDENTAFIRINIKYDGQPVDLTDNEEMKPKLDLFMQDGSIFIDEPLEILIPESGSMQYNIPNKVIKHAGKVNCKLFLDNGTKSVHVSNFSFTIVDSGVEDVVAKEISVNLVKDTVRQILSEDLTEVLDDGFKEKLTDDLKDYVSANKDEFKGEKGDSPNIVDSGWIPITLINGATNGTKANNVNAMYKMVKIDNLTTVYIQGNINVQFSNIIGNLPKEIAPKTKLWFLNLLIDTDGTLSSVNQMTPLNFFGSWTV